MKDDATDTKGEGTTIWEMFESALACRGYEVKDFKEGLPSAAVYTSWQKRSFTTERAKLQDAANRAVDALIVVTGKSYARCACGEAITERDIDRGEVAEVVRDGKHILVHYDSCRLEGDALA